MNLDKYGGRPIGHGGFGCVFRPSLPCQEFEPSNNFISKLMLKEAALEEYEEIKKFVVVLKSIPHHDKYFVLSNIRLCKPFEIPANQLVGFDEECSALTKHGITKSNINYKLGNLAMLVMPYGGITIDKFITKHYSSISLVNLNKALINLLEKAIVPMNKKNLYHCDLKASNILAKYEDNILNTRIIDWGLSIFYNNNKTIPDNLYRSFQFNLPFSVVIFSPNFIKMFQEFINLNPKPETYQFREFTINFLNVFFKERGKGHIKVIDRQIYRLYDKEIKTEDKRNILKYDFTYYHIIEYISSILETFTKNGSFYIDKYFRNVFIKNIDVWGFITCYFPIFEILYFNFESLTAVDLKLYNNLRFLFIHFLYETSSEAISIKEVTSFLTNLNPLISQSLIINEKNIKVLSS